MFGITTILADRHLIASPIDPRDRTANWLEIAIAKRLGFTPEYTMAYLSVVFDVRMCLIGQSVINDSGSSSTGARRRC